MTDHYIERLRNQAKQFKAIQRLLQADGSFKAMQQATICAGLSEVAEMLAVEAQDQAKLKKVREEYRDRSEIK